MKSNSTTYSGQGESNRTTFEPRFDDGLRLHEEPRLYPQRKRAWDKLIADIDHAHATLRFSRSSSLSKTPVN